MSLQATVPGRHRYIGPTMAAGGGYIYATKFMRSRPAKQMVSSFSKKFMAPFPDRDVIMRGRSKSRARGRSNRTPSPRRSSSMPAAPRKRARYVSRSRSSRSRSRSSSRGGSRRTVNVGIGSFSGTMGSRNKKVAPLSKMMAKGVQVCLEQANVVYTSSCQFVGHASCPTRVCKRGLWRALVKMILIKANKLNPDWNDVPIGVAPNDTFVVQYRDDMDPGSAISASIVTWVAGMKQDTIALNFAANFEAFSSQFTIDRIEYRPLNGAIGNSIIYLNNAHVEIDSLSQFKIQNQTVTLAVDDEADNVNNVPLIGKSYEGKGTGTKYQVERSSAVPFIADPIYGVIVRYGSTNDLAEPPSAKMFQQVLKSGKVSLGPGEIKTSTIHSKKSMGLQNFIALIYDSETDYAPKYKYKKLGEFKMYALEKQIDAVASTAENNIKVAYEHDLKFAMMVVPHAHTVTTQLYEQSIGAV